VKKILRVCLDTNVWISGILFSGAPSIVVELAFKKKFHLITSSFLLDEVRNNLVEKFEVEKKTVEKLIDSILIVADVYEPLGAVDIVKRDKSDNLVLETALLGKVSYLVTGDKRDLLPLKQVSGVKIIDPSTFLKEFIK